MIELIKQRERWNRWRLNNLEYHRAYQRERWAKVIYPAIRLKRYVGKRCKDCGIDMAHPTEGAKKSLVRCQSCVNNKRYRRKLYMREWRLKQKQNSSQQRNAYGVKRIW